jgi:DNA polymerase-3 subunit epsilon
MILKNLNKPVDFAGRMVYNESGEETFNFGKHKGKSVEEVLRIEPSYYSWMMQGDFPLYTKRKLEEIYNRWNAKKAAERQQKLVSQKPPEQATAETKPFENQVKKDFSKPYTPNLRHNNVHENRPFKKKDDEPAKPVNEDMLKQLADKFKKGL